ncbi:hypothetical protein HUK80_04490 [Flavobacterium sp. MAH-1]|uniref:O-antigen ligase n=1 Tax=Flavobacterium agri TaxID=2743471 RepID=A0A7Y8Y1L3_9FLAO|nr:hypothetical protein [Flavobacterium agri]NUY80143.1 hypothetical protein [Flavobacterium agri]NYA70168.1 hypothetical protein [Flavobacterium agri]
MKKLWRPNDGHPLTFFFSFLLLSVPFSLGMGNIALILFALASLFYFRQHRFFRASTTLLLPVALFLLMAASLIWSIDLPRSLKALPREIYLLAIPVCCMFFPGLDKQQKQSALTKYAYGMALVCVFYLLRATWQYFRTGDTGVFFYHELVTEEINAIHVSIYVATAFFALLPKTGKKRSDWLAMSVLALLVVLLSSKNVIVVFGLLTLVYFVFFSGITLKVKFIGFGFLFLFGVLPVLFFSNISDRFLQEIKSVATEGTRKDDTLGAVYNVSVSQAWNQTHFNQNDYFPGTAFRVYQFRIFIELLHEDGKYLQGYGLNASFRRIGDKARQYNLFDGDGIRKGYQGKNFHNQYVQNFSELGIFGFLLLVAMLFITFKKGIRNKDFTHISFAVLMISLFLTESFLLRQRGVMFFTAMYCLLNAGTVAVAVKKE